MQKLQILIRTDDQPNPCGLTDNRRPAREAKQATPKPPPAFITPKRNAPTREGQGRFILTGMTRKAKDQAVRSYRSRFITLVQAATKSFANFSFASDDPYTSASARS